MKSIYPILFFHLIKNILNTKSLYSIQRKLEENNDDKESPLLFNKIFSKFRTDWENKMNDFISQYVYVIPVPYKQEIDLYERITQIPCLMRGAFLNEEANTENDKINFKIFSPNNSIIFQADSIGDIFSLNLTEKGIYKLLFYNKVIKNEAHPTLVMNTGQNLIVEKNDLTETETKLDKIMTFLMRHEQENKINRGFRKKGNDILIYTNKYFFIFSLIETIVLIGVSVWQYYYLKNLFEIKGSL